MQPLALKQVNHWQMFIYYFTFQLYLDLSPSIYGHSQLG